ncbi:MAG: hypothetical protein HQK50_03865 [Oligoflexia bacterium]|nr:hypothetical protein [Oligoflexia bacterium]MBF0364680.1 hypothetical protein [Oligoflexia bacterium]
MELERWAKCFFSGVFLSYIAIWGIRGVMAQDYPKSSVETLGGSSTAAPEASSDGFGGTVFTEKVIKISASQKIFLISNGNKYLGEGDYISFIRDEQLIARALVAKVEDDRAGVKIVKIYSMKLWSGVRSDSDVQVIRGDDSYYVNLKKRSDEKGNKNSEEDDSASSVVMTEKELLSMADTDDIEDDDKGKRAIKTDNILSLSYGQYSGLDNDGSSRRYPHWNAQWAYQFFDNFWGEALYGRSEINSFPNDGLSTTLNNFTVRGKYTINAPFYSYIQPYVGYQMITVSSPDAGVQNNEKSLNESELERERRLVEQLKRRSVVFGITILKRLVPGWFVRADLGSDLLNVGFSFEF